MEKALLFLPINFAYKADTNITIFGISNDTVSVFQT